MLSKKVWLSILLTLVVFGGLVIYGDFRDVGSRLANFPSAYLLAALGLASLNYLIRFFRWAYYLKLLRIKISAADSALVFLAGLAMSVTPGKVGEVLKSYLLRDRAGVPVQSTAPVVVMERVTDVISVVLLGLSGLALLPRSMSVLMLAVLIALAIMGWFAISRFSDKLLGLPLIRRWKPGLESSRAILRQLAEPQPLVAAVVLGILAWFCEGAALWVIMRGLDTNVTLTLSIAIYAAATLVGAISTLPGGLVGTEGTMVALLQQAGVVRGPASAGTLLVRLGTLWFAVLLGLAALAYLARHSRNAPAPEESS